MKWMFLDLDSVVITWRTEDDKHPDYDCARFDDQCVEVLNEVLEAHPDLHIILTSDRRKWFSVWEMDQIFKWNGVKRSPVAFTRILETKFCPHGDELAMTRAEEIQIWLREQDHKDQMPYVVVDDLVMEEWFPGRFVDCSLPVAIGIATPGIKEKILNVLACFSN